VDVFLKIEVAIPIKAYLSILSLSLPIRKTHLTYITIEHQALKDYKYS